MKKQLKEKWLIWCELNAEQDKLEKVFGSDCVSIRGSTPPEEKENLEEVWRLGDVPILISKPSIFGTGLNWQHCHNVIFVGINDSYEMLFQATNRVHRFGQRQQVNRHLIFSQHEFPVLDNLKRKAEQAEVMWQQSSKYLKLHSAMATARQSIEYIPQSEMVLPDWLIAS